VALAYVFFTRSLAKSTRNLANETAQLVKETKTTRVAQASPVINVMISQLKESTNFFNLKIVNTGRLPARDIQFRVIEDFEYEKGKFISELPLFNEGIDLIGPGDSFSFFLTNMLEDFDRKVEEKLIIEANWKDTYSREVFEQHFTISFSYFKGLRFVSETDYMKNMANSLSSMERNLNSIIKHSTISALRMVYFNEEVIDEEERKILNRLRKD
jgi:hypothetical protein